MTITESNRSGAAAEGGRGPLIDEALLDRLMAQVDAEGVELLGPEGILTELTSRIMNRALEAERTAHLGYEADDRAGWGSGNSRWGHLPPGAAGKGEAPPPRRC